MGYHVRHLAAANEDAFGRPGEANQFLDPIDGLKLNGCGRRRQPPEP
jgi:hypothetical protein